MNESILTHRNLIIENFNIIRMAKDLGVIIEILIIETTKVILINKRIIIIQTIIIKKDRHIERELITHLWEHPEWVTEIISSPFGPSLIIDNVEMDIENTKEVRPQMNTTTILDDTITI